jgi:hypothetical protein
MPETPINKDGEAMVLEHEVWPAWQVGMAAPPGHMVLPEQAH